jgi:hypothetical protein
VSFLAPNSKETLDLYFDYKGQSTILASGSVPGGCIELAKRGAIVRCITEITMDNIADCKKICLPSATMLTKTLRFSLASNGCASSFNGDRQEKQESENL